MVQRRFLTNVQAVWSVYLLFILGSTVFSRWCHVCWPVYCGGCLICFTRVLQRMPLLCAFVLRMSPWFHSFSRLCLVALPVRGWRLRRMFRKVERVAVGCLPDFWLHLLWDVVVVSESGRGRQRGLCEERLTGWALKALKPKELNIIGIYSIIIIV